MASTDSNEPEAAPLVGALALVGIPVMMCTPPGIVIAVLLSGAVVSTAMILLQ